ncbi:MAG: alpha/beta fold hydrolase [Hyphomicrobiaceae bacterium]
MLAMPALDRSIFYPGGSIGFLLIHGLGGTPVELRYVARGLARSRHTVYCPQLAGHCGTEDELRVTTWHDWHASVVEAHEKLRTHCDVVIAGGLSMGAILALHLAAEKPESVHGTVLYAPTLKLDGWSMPWYSRLFRLVTQKWCADLFRFVERHPYGIKDKRFRNLVVEALHSGDSSQAGQFSTPGGTMLELRWLVNELRRELSDIQQPALIFHPRDDDRSSLESNAFYLQRHLGGLVDTIVLDDSYHIVTVDRQRDILVDRSDAFARWLAERHRHAATPPHALEPATAAE